MKTDPENISEKRILLVEDERAVREAVRSHLTRDSYIVVEANNGAEAFSIFTKGHFDLVLTDCAMPFVNGDELASRIRRVAPQQPILMFTGTGFKPMRNSAVNVVLQKPIDYDALQQAIVELMHPVSN